MNLLHGIEAKWKGNLIKVKGGNMKAEELIKKANGCGITAAAYQDKLLSRLKEGEKAINLINRLICEFQDSMNEKLFYEMLNVYCGADPKQ